MSARTTTKRRLMALLSAPLVMAGMVVAPASTAQAHDTISTTETWRDTSDCWCHLPDEYDGTVFQHDAGGEAYKGRIYANEELVGKIEFHPYDEKVWMYDTEVNGDGFYVQVSWTEPDGRWRRALDSPNSGHGVTDLDIAEGTTVRIQVWDDGFYFDDSQILDAYATA
ncbi:hypothetical protein [Ornithinimicrobium faecis]|uniref:hypothetical protein n=1 Tax=Ornithinimicrobium faecis TaxID=2934158 RepID=UPI002118FBBE|nr:hypothetical protein [Ornithinimicrobium sp. HY1745]